MMRGIPVSSFPLLSGLDFTFNLHGQVDESYLSKSSNGALQFLQLYSLILHRIYHQISQSILRVK